MDKILLNIALSLACQYARDNKIDVSGSHIRKTGRGYKYDLISDTTGDSLVHIEFSKYQSPKIY